MNLKEKLNEVKERSTGIYSFEEEDIVGVDVKLDDYEWLIKQAEQNKRYRDARKRIKQVYKDVYEISVEGHYKDGFLDGLDSVLEIIDWNNYKE
ncbi:MAG TPA: hypothetical protein VLA13_05825 [Massilibacterium sp.]|nr:hypothetical protein [Massilibacterium sp.]